MDMAGYVLFWPTQTKKYKTQLLMEGSSIQIIGCQIAKNFDLPEGQIYEPSMGKNLSLPATS